MNAGRPAKAPKIEASLRDQVRATFKTTKQHGRQLFNETKEKNLDKITANECWELAMSSLKGLKRPGQRASNKFQAGGSNTLTSTDIADCKAWVGLDDKQRLQKVQQLRAERR